MPYLGYYINLDRSPERRAAMEARLARLDPPGRYERFVAVDGNPHGFPSGGLSDAQLGCLASHHQLLRRHIGGAAHLHVVEDDILLAHRTVSFVEQIVLSGALDQQDILFTESLIPMVPDFCREARGRYQRFVERAADGTAMRVQFELIPYHSGTTSYLINRASIGKVCDILGHALNSGEGYPVDLLIRARAAEGALRVRSLFPFVTSIQPSAGNSTIAEGGDNQLTVLAMDLLRHSFFVECDIREALELARRRLPVPDLDPLDALQALIAGFLASDRYQQF